MPSSSIATPSLFRSKKQKNMKISLSINKLIYTMVCIALSFLIVNVSLFHIKSSSLPPEKLDTYPLKVAPIASNNKNVPSNNKYVNSNNKNVTSNINKTPTSSNIKTVTSNSNKNVPSNNEDVRYHVIFSTGCSIRQDWQSYVFFYHVMKSGQLGDVTRIASGCNQKESKELKEVHTREIQTMSPHYHLHLTPEYTNVRPGARFKYFNKPFGVRHWMEHKLGYPNNVTKMEHDTIIILFDPDQMILRPITNDFTNSIEQWNPSSVLNPPSNLQVKHGSPFAQMYGFYSAWKKHTNITAFARKEELPSPVETMPLTEAAQNYAAGPPYIATSLDMYHIVEKWTEFVPHIHEQHPHILAEMFGYSMAAAHLNLPHQLAHSFMLSDIKAAYSEGWDIFVDKFSELDVCLQVPKSHLPHVLHYCQKYSLGKYFIAKTRLPKDFLSCESPLLLLPPSNVGTLYNFNIKPWEGAEKEFMSPKQVKRSTFMLCYFMNGLNEAATYYKQNNCEPGTANYNETISFHDSMEIDE